MISPVYCIRAMHNKCQMIIIDARSLPYAMKYEIQCMLLLLLNASNVGCLSPSPDLRFSLCI